MDETTIAFESPLMRAVATGGTELPDRISVRDYVRDIEIGAFKSERGVAQRVRFNVVMEVSRHVAAQDDDVDKVISYDTITEAISQILASERINLLETLAERLAEICLADPRASRIFVRIEKLDRIPGALGVEIVRSRLPEGAPSIVPIEKTAIQNGTPGPEILFLSNEVIASDMLGNWIDAALSRPLPVAICVPELPGFEHMLEGEAGLRNILLSVEQNCWALGARDGRVTVVDSKTEMDWALKNNKLPVWAPQRIMAAAGVKLNFEACRPDNLALFLAKTLHASAVSFVGATLVPNIGELQAHHFAVNEFSKYQG